MSSPLQLYVGIVFAGLHFAIDSRAAPYKRFAENRFHGAAQAAIFLTLLMGGIIQGEELSHGEGTTTLAAYLAGVVMMVVNILVLVLAVTLLVIAVRKKRRVRVAGRAIPPQ